MNFTKSLSPLALALVFGTLLTGCGAPATEEEANQNEQAFAWGGPAPAGVYCTDFRKLDHAWFGNEWAGNAIWDNGQGAYCVIPEMNQWCPPGEPNCEWWNPYVWFSQSCRATGPGQGFYESDGGGTIYTGFKYPVLQNPGVNGGQCCLGAEQFMDYNNGNYYYSNGKCQYCQYSSKNAWKKAGGKAHNTYSLANIPSGMAFGGTCQ